MSFLLTADDQKTPIPLPSAALLTLPVNPAVAVWHLWVDVC